MTVVLTPNSGSAYTAAVKEISVVKKSNNKITPVKGTAPVIVRLGKTASMKIVFRVYGDTDYAIIAGWGGETIMTLSSSSYADLPDGTYLLKNLESKQKPGNLSIRDVSLDLEYAYGGTVI